MFERFKRSRGTGATATRDRELDERSPRVEEARFERISPGERDRSVVAGAGDADMAADRPFEREEMARGDGAALDRDSARDDLAARDDDRLRDDVGREDAAARDDAVARDDRRDDAHEHDEHDGRAALGGAAAAGGAAALAHHHREDERDEDAREDLAGRDRTLVHDRDGVGDRGLVDDREGIRDREFVGDRGVADDGLERHAPVMAPAALDTVRARQRDRFGGIQWGSDFFGWLCAIGLASLLTAALVGAGVALGLSTSDAQTPDGAQTIGLGGGIALLVVLAIAWTCGGYVAGRMARFDGARQGLGVWLWTILSAIVVAAAAAIGGSEYDIYERLNLPRIAVGDTTLTAGGAIAGAAAIVVTLVFAVIGGKIGERFHRRVDRVATDEYVVER